jgi:hypothetical protein
MKHTTETGQMLLFAIIVVAILLVNTLLITSGSLRLSQNSKFTLTQLQALNLAEAGVDKALASLNTSAGSYTGQAETALGPGSFEVTVTSPNTTTKTITSTGYIPNKTNYKTKKSVTINVSRGTGLAFNYGVQVGDGGFQLGQNAVINGSVYSGNNFTAGNNSLISGDVYISGGVSPSADQQSTCSGISCTDYLFGRNVSGQNRQYVAQSFQPAATNVLAKITLMVKRFGSGNLSNVTVRIMGDNAGKPDKNNILTTGTLYSSLVTSTYGLITVAFSTRPTLTANTRYWIMLDVPSLDSTNYWAWQMDSSQSYTRGSPSWTSNWQTGNPNWQSITGDMQFETFMGGTATSFTGAPGVTVTGDLHANTISSVTINKGAYYQAITNSTAATYHPGSADPGSLAMPISDAQITQWKTEAEAAGVTTGDLSTCQTLAAGKRVGNVTLSNCTISASSPIWITGNLVLNNQNTVSLGNSYGSNSGVIVVDGTITVGNGNVVNGTGQGDSAIFLISTYDSKSNGQTAVDIQNSGNQVIVYAGDGIVNVSNGNTMEQVTAWKIIVGNNVTLNYNTGFASQFFSAGPGGAYSVIKGTYQQK